MRPRPCRAMKLIASGVTQSAASTRSPSFSRSSSSTSTTIRPALRSAMMSVIGAMAHGWCVAAERYILPAARVAMPAIVARHAVSHSSASREKRAATRVMQQLHRPGGVGNSASVARVSSLSGSAIVGDDAEMMAPGDEQRSGHPGRAISGHASHSSRVCRRNSASPRAPTASSSGAVVRGARWTGDKRAASASSSLRSTLYENSTIGARSWTPDSDTPPASGARQGPRRPSPSRTSSPPDGPLPNGPRRRSASTPAPCAPPSRASHASA